jgi:hypothetical protein
MSSISFFLIIMSLFSLGFCNFSYAACSRDDVDYYLGKGFSIEQITIVCGKETAVTPQVESNITTMTKQENVQENTVFLKAEIKANQIQFDANKFYFNRRECVEYSNLSGLETPKKFCANFRTIVNYSGLKVLESKNFTIDNFRNPSVVVEGNVKKEILETKKFKSLLTTFEQQLVMKKIGLRKAHIPLRQSGSSQEVKTKLRNLAE